MAKCFQLVEKFISLDCLGIFLSLYAAIGFFSFFSSVSNSVLDFIIRRWDRGSGHKNRFYLLTYLVSFYLLYCVIP